LIYKILSYRFSGEVNGARGTNLAAGG